MADTNTLATQPETCCTAPPQTFAQQIDESAPLGLPPAPLEHRDIPVNEQAPVEAAAGVDPALHALPVSERVKHKDWKVRQDAAQEAVENMNSLSEFDLVMVEKYGTTTFTSVI